MLPTKYEPSQPGAVATVEDLKSYVSSIQAEDYDDAIQKCSDWHGLNKKAKEQLVYQALIHGNKEGVSRNQVYDDLPKGFLGKGTFYRWVNAATEDQQKQFPPASAAGRPAIISQMGNSEEVTERTLADCEPLSPVKKEGVTLAHHEPVSQVKEAAKGTLADHEPVSPTRWNQLPLSVRLRCIQAELEDYPQLVFSLDSGIRQAFAKAFGPLGPIHGRSDTTIINSWSPEAKAWRKQKREEATAEVRKELVTPKGCLQALQKLLEADPAAFAKDKDLTELTEKVTALLVEMV